LKDERRLALFTFVEDVSSGPMGQRCGSLPQLVQPLTEAHVVGPPVTQIGYQTARDLQPQTAVNVHISRQFGQGPALIHGHGR
jgi:hypothetical protein